ncbi:hypothetical protein MNBD_GAMMA26-652 [hydrothermal vent metagenome]|uniref:PIN domain-containing protein n=1 Tax=hydrothermal vent metagenome TaxID=652676 RepID=A0A3B1AW63_9ZZZZ
MIGLDSNVVIRYLVQDDKAQAGKANRLIEKVLTPERPGLINHITLAEIAWVLKRCYGVTKPELVNILEGLLTTKQLLVENIEVAWKALRAFEAGNGDFSDALIAYLNQQLGCEDTVTFDKRAAKLEPMKLI